MSAVIKKRSCIVLALLLLFFCWAAPQADAIALIDDAAVVIAACLGAWGIGMTVTGSWGTVSDYITQKIDDYCSDIGSTVTDWLASWSIQMGRNGTLVANVAAAGALASFASWLVSSTNLQNNATQLVSTTSLYLMQDGSQFVWGRIDDTHSFPLSLGTIFQVGETYALANGTEFLIERSGSNRGFRFKRTKAGIGAAGTVSYTFDGQSVNTNFNYYCFVSNFSGGYADNGTQTNPVLAVFLDSNGNLWDWPTGRSSSSFAYSAKTLFGDASSEQLAVTTGVIDIPVAGELEDAGLVIDVDLPAGTTLSQAIPAIQTGIVAGTLTPTAEIVGEAVLPETLPNIGAAPDYEVTGLAQVFPFCIPFDLYDFFSILAAEPQAPSFDIPFVIPGLVDYTFHLDLAPFSSVAAILRTMELLLFIVGLILLTRRIIRG